MIAKAASCFDRIIMCFILEEQTIGPAY